MEQPPKDNSSEPTLEVSNTSVTLESLKEEIEALRANVQNRKKETTVLKVMLYTGVILLMLAYFYSNDSIQQTQLDAVEIKLNQYKNELRSDQERAFESIQDNIYDQIASMKVNMENISKSNAIANSGQLENTIREMNDRLGSLNINSPQLEQLVTQIKEDSEKFISTYKFHAE